MKQYIKNQIQKEVEQQRESIYMDINFMLNNPHSRSSVKYIIYKRIAQLADIKVLENSLNDPNIDW